MIRDGKEAHTVPLKKEKIHTRHWEAGDILGKSDA